MEGTDFTNSFENGSRDEGIKVVGSENKVQESCNLQPKQDNAIIKTEIKMEDDDSSQSASENEESHFTSGHESCDLQAVLDNEIVKTEIKKEDDDISDSSTDNGSKDEGNFTVETEGNGQEPNPLEDVLDNTIVKSEIKMEEDDIIDCPTENSSNDDEVNKDVHTESNEQDNIRIEDYVFSNSEIQFLQKLRSRLPLNEIVPEHAGRKHKATTNEMPTEKETTNISWTKLNNVLFKDGILIDNAKFLHSFIQAALFQKSGQPSILNVKNNTVDTEEKGQKTFECSQIEMRNLVVMKEKITVDDTLLCNSAIQSGFNNNAETNENSLNKEKRLESSEVPETELNNTILKAIDTTEDAHIRVSAHPINFDKSSGRYEEVTTAKKFQDVEVESVIQIVRKCSVSLERLPSIEKYCKEPINYPIGVLAALRFQSNEMSAEMNAKGLINDSEAYKTTKENNDFLFINPCGLNNKPEPVDAEMDGQHPLACIVYGEDDILSPEEVYDDDDILSSEEVYDDDDDYILSSEKVSDDYDDILSSDVEYVDSKEVQDKVVSTDTDLHNPNQKIEIAHTNYKCNVCGETFTLKSNCQLHLLFHGKMKCLKCHRMFDNGVALKNHMQTNHNEKSPPHKKHLSIHMDKNVHNCSVCHKSFIDHKSLLNHKLIHQFTNNYKCIHCNKSYETIVHLNKHLITHDARLVESDSKKKVGSDEEVITECEFQDLSDECIDADQDFSDEDDQPLSVLIKQNPSKYNVKNDAGSGKEVSTELECQDMVTENNGQNPPKDRIKNKTVPISNTEVSTDVKFQNLSDKCGNVNQQKSILIDTNRNNKSKNKEVTGQSSAGSDEKVFNDIEFHHDFNVDNAEMDGEHTLACIEIYDVDDVLSSDVEFVDSKEVQGKVVSTEKDLHDRNQKIEIAHKNYKCNICDKTFTLKSKCQLHLLIYHRNMKCLECHRMFDNGVALNNHMQTNHNEEPPPRKNHLSIHMDKNIHNCSVCHKSFIDHKSLLNHKRIHQFTNSYKCIHCNKSYESIVHLNKHLVTHDARLVESDSKEKAVSDEEVITECKFQDLSDHCIDVDQDFSDEDDQPLSVLPKQNPLNYNVKNKAGLGKQVSTELEFQDILTENDGQNPPEDRIKNKTVPILNTEVSTDVKFQNLSDKCGDVNQQISLLIDTNRNNKSKNKEVTGQSSAEVFNDIEFHQDLNVDNAEMDGQYTLTCKEVYDVDDILSSDVEFVDSKEVPDKVVSTEKDLHDPNQKMQSAHKNYKCNICNETFTLISKFQLHLLYHRNMKCLKCHRMFVNGVALNNHMQTNHNEEPSPRKKHLSIHMDKKVHNCSVCHKSFIDHKSLLNHKLIHQFTNSYKCIHCNKSYDTIVHLNKHMLTHDARPVESDSKEKVGSDEELSTEVFQDVSDRCIDIDQDFSDEDDQPLSVLTKQNPSKYNVKNKAGLGKQVSTELEFQNILTENNGQNPPEDRIKNKTGPVPNTEVSTYVSTEFHQDLNIDKNLSESANHQKNYTCIGSGDMFTTIEELRKHEITHKKYECDLCENVYNQYSKYQQHLKYHIDGDKLKCLHCRKSFDSGLTLKCHMQTRNCKQCRKCYCSSAALKKHIQLDHSGIHAYKCTRCDEGFLLAEELDKHSLIHREKRPYTCQLCYKSFSGSDSLYHHSVRHSAKKDYECTKCGKFLATKSSLNVHMLFHSGVKDHICNICSKAFRKPSELRRHLIMHTGIKPHKCPLCDTGFTHINPLKRHLVIIHYGTKEHKCIHCNECFALFPDLVKHYAIHKDPRPYKCKKCPKSFIRQQNIVTHMVSHSAVKPLQCEQCGSSFRLPHHLRNHLLTHSAKKRPKRK